MAEGAKYKDWSEDPLTEKERRDIYRHTSDPLSFHENFVNWLNNKYIDEFFNPPHGAQLTLTDPYTNPGASSDVVPFDRIDHDTNGYVSDDGEFTIVAKMEGVYAISVDFTFSSAGSDATAAIYVNDVPIAAGTWFTDVVSLCVVRALAAGDVVTAQVFNSAGTQSIDPDADIPAVFNIARIYAINVAPDVEPCVPPVLTVDENPEISATSITFPFNTDTATVDDDGTWTGDPVIVFTYQWYYKYQTNSAPYTAYAVIPGATGSTLDLDADLWPLVDIDGLLEVTIKCRVTATNGCSASSADSNDWFFAAQ